MRDREQIGVNIVASGAVEAVAIEAAAKVFDSLAGCTIPMNFAAKVRSGETSELVDAFKEAVRVSLATPSDQEKLADPLPGHWDDPDPDMIRTYAARSRESLMNGTMTDFALANRQYMADRGDLDLLAWQTAAKERIRWLSVQLALTRTEGSRT